MTAKPSNKPQVLIMMSTYNGERYLHEQLDSILEQEGVEITLQIADDGSADNSCAICEEYANQYDNVSFKRNERNLGYALSFMEMARNADCDAFDFFAFSDQDDIWKSDRLLKAIGKLSGHDNKMPLLYHSNYQFVDADLVFIENRYPDSYPQFDEKKLFLSGGVVAGCSLIFNAALCKLLKRYRGKSFPHAHDTWTWAVACYCGVSVYDETTAGLSRRIHGGNVTGRNKHRLTERWKGRMERWANFGDEPIRKTALLLLETYPNEISPCDQAILREFCDYKTSLKIKYSMLRGANALRNVDGSRVTTILRIIFNRL